MRDLVRRLLFILLPIAPLAAAQTDLTAYDRAVAAGYKAAFLCSGIFNAGRTADQIEAWELSGIYPEYDALLARLDARIDHERRQVAVAFDSDLPPRVAAWRPNLGCAQLPIGADSATSASLPRLDRTAPDLEGVPWPTGERDASAGSRARVDAFERVISGAFGEDYGAQTRTTAVLVVQRGQIVAERYRDGFGPHVAQRTWSVAKSVASTIVGAAVLAGRLDPARPAPIPEWQRPGDPRLRITTDLLLRMASGLHSDTAGNRTDAIYFGGTAVTERTVAWPLERSPGSHFRYANNDILLAIRGLRARLGDGEPALAFPFEAVLWKIGMTRTWLETDWQGNFVLSSQVWSTARDLARLGLFYLQDGVWNGERLLPEGWRDYVSRPSGPQPDGDLGYGAGFWLLGGSHPAVPTDTFAALGNRGQVVVVLPSRDLVVVRRGEDPAGSRFDFVRFTVDTLQTLD